MFHLILNLLLKISFWANFYPSYYIILSYLVKNSIQRNMNRRGEKRVGTRWENSPSFIKTTREMNQWHWRANNRYIYLENGWKRLHILFGKSSILDCEPSTQYNHSDFVQFLTSTDVPIRKYSSMFGFPGKIHWWILNGISKMSVLMWLRFQLVTSSTPQGLFRVFRMRFCFTHVLWQEIS